MEQRLDKAAYFPFGIQITQACGEKVQLKEILEETRGVPGIVFARRLVKRLKEVDPTPGSDYQPGLIHLYAMLNRIYRYLLGSYFQTQQPGLLARLMADAGYPGFSGDAERLLKSFAELFPGTEMVLGRETPQGFLAGDDAGQSRRMLLASESYLLKIGGENRALDGFRRIFDDRELAEKAPFLQVMGAFDKLLAQAPPFVPLDLPLSKLLRAPIEASPHSLPGQIQYIKDNWSAILPPDLLSELLTALEVAKEEWRMFFGGPGKPQVLEFGRQGLGPFGGHDYPEYERFSRDADWMANVVMIAKMVYVWLGQLSRSYGIEIHRLDQIPDQELDRLARWGFSGLWLIGIWERSPASQKIKRIGGNYEAISSAYSLYDYVIAWDLGGEEALQNLKARCAARGIRLASDMVPNHTGLYSKWVREHPDWFIQLDYPPYPSYQYNGPDLSEDGSLGLFIEDGYWDKRDAAVVFKHLDRNSGRVRYIYHGNDGTSTPWNDTAQLNYLMPEVREAVIQTILHVARQFPIIRFDAAMTLAKKHYQRLWFPLPGHSGGVPSRAEHGLDRPSFDEVFPVEFWREVVDRVAVEAPDTLLLAEAFWLMEGYFVRTLGMHRVYNSAFMNMLKMEENAKYRQTIKNVLEFDPEILKRFVNFMNNPDERTAVEQFGKEGKYFGASVLLVTMPGLPMFGHGQIEGFHEKYGMEYRRAMWEEPVDEHLVARHEAQIFPLMRRRYLFSGSDQFVLYDFYSGGHVDENVFAYSNRAGGDRGIIFYHNRFGSTSGWIRDSSAIAKKDGNGGSHLVRKTLGEALGFLDDGRHYYSFRDYATGLEYLRNGRDLCEKGLYVELHAYDYHAFLDFRELWDDEYGTFGAVCYQLNGCGVECLDEEVKQVRYRAVNDQLRILLEKVTRVGAENLAEGTEALMPPLEPLLAGFYRAAAPQSKEKAQRALLATFGWEMEQALRHVAPEFVKNPNGWLLLCSYLALHRLGELKEMTSAELCEQYGLIRPVVESFAALAAAEPELPPVLPPKGWGELLALLLESEEFWAVVREKGTAAGCQLLLDNEKVATFVGLHESGGVTWFVKEQFQLLFSWLAAIAPFAAPPEEPEAAGKLAGALLETAEAAGYRLDQFLSLVEEMA
ncbi:alpha-amylase family glycosyl hydrolase [Geomesophilobacter sediminis]|uniref:Alpha-amylase n=1 Tax=Geomesophilobacter sediminis TaxID=2798584 RepID=A0A8J7M0U9_9BACT|nr:alpha-amylase family glycosyl hydrolase [Geomesophilobacter sediminis]MBJ6726538.1 alpha-amylase [Geomesophilobacter sediminis]